jgi:hydrogenase maturation protein HypF
MPPPPLHLHLRGLVQGVGFRPYVWRLANELGLNGWVRNDSAGVTIAVNGEKVEEFMTRLPLALPPLARVDEMRVETFDEARPAPVFSPGFHILGSEAGAVTTAIGPDAAICPDCIGEICDPSSRRWRYAFTTCTHCGPRFTVSAGLPYDRARTSLAGFPLCQPCEQEYTDPADRRFHAETTCCPDCGPSLRLLDEKGAEIAVDRKNSPKTTDPIRATLSLLQAGKIVAIKGLGGFHLACDARNADAVARLRARKHRDAKPFAVMGINEASLAPFADIRPSDAALLRTCAAPIVLCRKTDRELPGIAPNLAWLGVMLPSTPLHLLLWHEAAGRPDGTDWLLRPQDLLLVMTSANPQGEPLVIDDTEALQRLAGPDTAIADAFLTHNRNIVVRCDDSVLRSTPQGATFLRRARGYVPTPIPLRQTAEKEVDGLALGGYLKNTICVTRGNDAFLSQHIGGLDNPAAITFLEECISHLLAILDVRPRWIAHDRHPDFPSTQLALRLAEQFGVPAVAVSHHHAHLAAVAAEHGSNEALLGLAIDGLGLGDDGGAWGGELLRLDGGNCRRVGHLRELALPGGDRAAREPWRMAIAALHAAGLKDQAGHWLARHWPEREAGPLLQLLDRGLRCPPTSSLGRWFDAAAGLLGICAVSAFEGEAAMRLESLAAQHGTVDPLVSGWRWLNDGQQLDFLPLMSALADIRNPAYGAALFHATVADGLANWLKFAVDRENVTKIAVSGGCAMNLTLTSALRSTLAASGLELLEARRAPANDGGLALGQAWVARQQYALAVK